MYRPRHGDARPFLFGVLAGFLLALLPWEGMVLGVLDMAGQARLRSMERRALSTMVKEAYRHKLSYDEIAEQPEDFTGRHVVWCVDHPARGVSYLNGRPSQPLVWVNEDELPVNSPVNGGRCTTVLAVVKGAGPRGVRLRYLGLP